MAKIKKYLFGKSNEKKTKTILKEKENKSKKNQKNQKNKTPKKDVDFYHNSKRKKILDIICGFFGCIFLNVVLVYLSMPIIFILSANNFEKYIFILEIIVIILEALIPLKFFKTRKSLAIAFWLALILVAAFLLPYYYDLSMQRPIIHGIL
ncbi:hypothetical protein HYU21_00420 [Candidatus Woesearchaeota archaeon]|nr:hypothetical protein [Candidatus Woesearchaeota archaeon]